MNNQPWSLKLIRKTILCSILLVTANICYSQSKTEEAKKITDDIILIYDVIYERKLTNEELKSPEYFEEVTLIFNNEKMIERRIRNKTNGDQYLLYDFSKKKTYNCTVLEKSKNAIEYDFQEPKITVEPFSDIEPKKITDFPVEKGFVIMNKKPRENYYTTQLGLNYCKYFKTKGFILQYPGYSNQLGHYTVVAKKVIYEKMPQSYYSLNDFKTQTYDEYTKSRKEAEEKRKEISAKNIGKKAQYIKDIDLKKTKINTKIMLGEVVVLNFWFTSCPPCKAEIPKLNELKEKYKNEKVNFIAIALDESDRIENFLAKTPLNYSIISEGREIANDFDVTSYPTNIIIDKNGIVQFYDTGYKSDIVTKISTIIDQINNK